MEQPSCPSFPTSSTYGVRVSTSPPSRIPCVGGILLDERLGRRRLLLVRRGQEPAKGTWSIPGGRVEPGENDVDAIVREVLEETGLAVACGPLVGTVERSAPTGGVYVINDYECFPLPGADVGAVRAGDDAADARWFGLEELTTLDCAPGLVAALTEWGVLAES
jgi:8-oxo-dGTP diphosphatase